MIEIVAKDVRELKKALQQPVAVGEWTVERGERGHYAILCYDAYGNLHTIIRNKD